jgi:hypothetical protein
MFRLVAFLAAAAFCAPKASDFKPKWKNNQVWKVEYSYRQASPAAVAAPVEQRRVELWSYHLKAEADGSWLMTLRELRTAATPERYEVVFGPDQDLRSVVRFNHLGEKSQVFNDIEEGETGFRADSTRTPLLDWPGWSGGTVEKDALRQELRKGGYSGFLDTFTWRKKKPWWTQAERRYGDTAISGRLL